MGICIFYNDYNTFYTVLDYLANLKAIVFLTIYIICVEYEIFAYVKKQMNNKYLLYRYS